MPSRPRVITKCVADHYHGPRERIVEFNSACGGGLMCFTETEQGQLIVDIYRCDPSVVVRAASYRAESIP